jgi:hypothetical protein
VERERRLFFLRLVTENNLKFKVKEDVVLMFMAWPHQAGELEIITVCK